MKKNFFFDFFVLLDDIRNTKEGFGTCGWILVAISYALCVLTFPFSLCVTVKVRKIEKEYDEKSLYNRLYKNIKEQLLCVLVEYCLVRKRRKLVKY
jgi:hypothetical protein